MYICVCVCVCARSRVCVCVCVCVCVSAIKVSQPLLQTCQKKKNLKTINYWTKN